jgi:predicted PurR-regulated permease PerM
MKPHKIEYYYRLVIFTVLILLFIWLLFQIRQLLVILFISVIFMSALNPSVARLTKLRISRTFSIGILYFFIILLIGIVTGVITPPIVKQSNVLVTRIPDYLRLLEPYNISSDLIVVQISKLGYLPTSLINFTIGIFSNIVGILLTAIVTFYLLIERENLNKYLALIIGSAKAEKAENIINEIENKLGGWVRAEIALMFILGILVYIGLSVLHVEYAIPLAILAGLMEVVPNIGPVISAVPAVSIGLLISPITGLAVIVLFVLVHQLENSLIVPQIMAKEVGIDPLLTILSLDIGFQIGGIAGAVLAVPVLLVIQILLKEFGYIYTLRTPNSP